MTILLKITILRIEFENLFLLIPNPRLINPEIANHFRWITLTEERPRLGYRTRTE